MQKPAPTQYAVHDLIQRRPGFVVEKARDLLNLPAGHEPVAMIALGYLGDPNTLPEQLRLRELASRTRKPFTEFVHAGRWGQSLSLVMHATETQP